MTARWHPRDLIVACVWFLFFLAPVARGEPSVVVSRTGPDGRTQYEPLPPGTGLVQVVANGRVVSSRHVDVNAPLRVIVEFDTPPAVRIASRMDGGCLPLVPGDPMDSGGYNIGLSGGGRRPSSCSAGPNVCLGLR